MAHRAGAAARHFYHAGEEDAHAAADVLRLLAHPRWLDMTVTDIPPGCCDYRRHAERFFPSAALTDDLHPLGIQTAFTWQAPAT